MGRAKERNEGIEMILEDVILVITGAGQGIGWSLAGDGSRSFLECDLDGAYSPSRASI
jgi:hypothetical protein